MPNVDEITEAIISREGGYVNDPDDPGGPTRWGVTLAALQRFRASKGDDRKPTARDVATLTRSEAKALYLQDYYARPGLARLPEALQPQVYDMYVNSGRAAVTILQRLLTEMGEPLAADGVIGPKTEAAAARAAAAAPGHIADAYGIARREWYYALGDARPSLRKFARRRDGGKGGWIARAEEFIAPRYRLSDAEHRARVASWG